VFFTDSITGYAVGGNGTILKTGHGGEPTLAVSPTIRIVGSKAGVTSFFVSSNTRWNAFSDSSWCTVTPSGSGNDSIIVAYSENRSAKPRVDTIHVYIPQLPILLMEVAVIQEGVNGIDNISNCAFRIFPNPATHAITITDARNHSQDKTVCLFTSTGDLVNCYHFRNQQQVEIDVSNWVKGIYLVKMQSDQGIEVQKLVIQ
jgi:hypothetical protein